MNTPILLGPTEDYETSEDGIVFHNDQEIGKDFWDDLAFQQEVFSFRLNGLTPVASIPEALVDHWIRQGFDFDNASASEIQKKLKAEGYDKFLVTEKTF